MNKKREVTERDLRAPEFAEGDPSDYEFRADGKIVRKDRWERGVRDIASILIGARGEFEIDDIVEGVRQLRNGMGQFELRVEGTPRTLLLTGLNTADDVNTAAYQDDESGTIYFMPLADFYDLHTKVRA